MVLQFTMVKERYLKRIQLAKDTNAPFGVGAFLPGNILIIGEQASDPATAPDQQPFCDNKGCSGWLNKKLEEAGIPEEKLFWVNALNNDDSAVDLKKLVNQLKPSHVISLGGVAHRACIHQKIASSQFYHPQYWKRFQSKLPYDLIDYLQYRLQRPMVSIENWDSLVGYNGQSQMDVAMFYCPYIPKMVLQ